jgi:hypothetical protein
VTVFSATVPAAPDHIRRVAEAHLYVTTEVTDPLTPEALVGYAVLQKLEN